MGCASTRTLLLNTTSRRGKRIPTINVRWWILAALMRIIVPSVAVRAIGRTATTADRSWSRALAGLSIWRSSASLFFDEHQRRQDLRGKDYLKIALSCVGRV